jgi:antitoxin HigA-1
MPMDEKLTPVHPGEILLEEFLKPLGLSQNRLALDIHVPARRINEIVHGKRRITADTALRLARYFQMSPQFWLGLQMDYDLDVAEDTLAERLDREIKVSMILPEQNLQTGAHSLSAVI